MALSDLRTLVQMPAEILSFTISPAQPQDSEARHGCLSFHERNPIETPHFIGISSRGVVPHLSQDMMRDQTSIKGIYTSLEDYLERLPKPPAVSGFPCGPTESPLRRFIALQNGSMLILGPRRLPPVYTPASNTYTSINISTSVGYRTLEVEDYIEAARRLRPDIIVGIVDAEVEKERKSPGLKRREKMSERSLAWMRGLRSGLSETTHEGRTARNLWAPNLWAPILPIESEMQREYLEWLEEEDIAVSLGGVVLYDVSSIDSIPLSLSSKPRLALTSPNIPQDILHQIGLGIDIFTVPFITAATEAGTALSFSFPVSASSSNLLSLGANMWSSEYATNLSPLEEDCQCYTCKVHHRAYLQHLLSAKEMLAWVLLQIHNHHVLDCFFAGVRASIGQGTFKEEARRFETAYEQEINLGTGMGPRIRGYQSRDAGPTPKKKNLRSYKKLESIKSERNDTNGKLAKITGTPLTSPDSYEKDLEDIGLTNLIG